MPNITITDEIRSNFREAVFHVLSEWDALKAIEGEVQDQGEQCANWEITSDDISGLCADLSDPHEAYDRLTLTDEMIDKCILSVGEQK